MKVLHIVFGGPYTENMTYQDNLLPRAHAELGIDTILFANCYSWDKGNVIKVDEENKKLADGVVLKRFKYKRILNEWISEKLRVIPNLYEKLVDEKPDVIMVHSPQTLSSSAIIDYVKKHKGVRLVVDSHSDFYNTARNFLSVFFLHKIVYRSSVRRLCNFAENVYCVSVDVIDFLNEMYGISKNKMEYLPLGGFILDDEHYQMNRINGRERLGYVSDDIVLIHSGKLTEEKKTIWLINAMSRIKNSRIKLLILGSAEGDLYDLIVSAQKEDNRIKYYGWVSGDELVELLCAGDVYAQPGTQSATLHNAMCCRCFIMTYPHNSYVELLDENACFVENEDDVVDFMAKMCNGWEQFNIQRDSIFTIAKNRLDYYEQAKSIMGRKMNE